ncbi:hypothetical protein [uncultured Phenylobacterium sp.]|uniref:ORC-CDC6 family AAA ATPase n=1 Tax=uncultured Phenylobacterium sp. TaxID=349273 RepID=UPI0025DE6DB2|nr:hypothetical protein [uncultured Phenylobacterium sp.]
MSVSWTPVDRAAQVAEVFGGFRAEWLSENIFSYFTQPAYFPELQTRRPCVLAGGRGSGKTTVLLCLSYEGQFALNGRDPAKVADWPYYGVYYRVDTNRVTAFAGPELSRLQWRRLFGHYLNLILVGRLLDFLSWWEETVTAEPALTPGECRRLATSLHLEPCATLADLKRALFDGQLGFEAYLNNIDAAALPKVSLQGAPLRYLTDLLVTKSGFEGKQFFLLIDEYENLLEDQQVVVNTLIKHSGGSHTFKVGVKDLGWKSRATLNPDQILNSPADYALVDIGSSLSEPEFAALAQRVLNSRLKHVFPELHDVVDLLPELPLEKEAELLGVDERVAGFEAALGDERALLVFARGLRPLQRFFIQLWSEAQGVPIRDLVAAWKRNGTEWSTRYENNKYAILFAIRRKKAGTRKYYSGWSVYVKLAASNLRYLLELSVQALILNARAGGEGPVPHTLQTQAAEDVAAKNFRELDGMSIHGGRLAKLLLGLGRVFYVMARQPEGHAPEVNQFHFGGEAVVPAELAQLLDDGVMHLALVRWSGNKLSLNQVNQFDYAIHPMFAPFFVFSFRKKRKIKLEPETLLALIERPRDAISALVRRVGRTDDDDLPEQLSLFEGYYGRPAA